MKKLYSAILIIALAIALLGCDDKKAKDEIKKALDEVVTEEDNADSKQGNTQGKPVQVAEDDTAGDDTPAPTLTKPVLSTYRLRAGQAATFPKVEGHTYTLKEAINGVTLNVSDENTGQVTSTVAATGVVIVATLDGTSEDSDPIEFVLIELTKPELNIYVVSIGEAVTFPKVEGHTYALKEAVNGVTLDVSDENTGRVSSIEVVSGVIVVATLDDTSEESEPIEFLTPPLELPALSSYRVRVGESATFTKVAGLSYTLSHNSGLDISSVTLDVTDANTGRVSSTEAISGIILVASKDRSSAYSKPIEFFVEE